MFEGKRVTVAIEATDPITAAGVAAELRLRSEVLVVDPADPGAPAVAVVAVDEIDSATTQTIRSAQRDLSSRVVVIATHLDDAGLMAAVEAGACGILRRYDAQPERVVSAVLAAARGNGSIPEDLLGRLLDQIGQLQRQVLGPKGMSLNGFSGREIDVLRLLADGWDTADIASKLSYSERTVKSVIHDIVVRLQLRNRSHAVAYAVREGLI
jgi:DNA-binding NarL/FixJ family response regulator